MQVNILLKGNGIPEVVYGRKEMGYLIPAVVYGRKYKRSPYT